MYLNQPKMEAQKNTACESDKILAFLKLNKHYFSGSGDWLSYLDDIGNERRVLDLCGSYGINLLGHNNAIIRKLLHTYSAPTFTQVSASPLKQQLSAKLEYLICSHTGKPNWAIEYANTGTEIIEAALKICWINYQKKLESIKQQINYTVNFLEEHPSIYDSTEGITDQFNKINILPFVAHLENSFHGKSHGSLTAIDQHSISAIFPTPYQRLQIPKDVKQINKVIDDLEIEYLVINPVTGKMITKYFIPIIGLFFEPIQGEAGVFPIQTEILSAIQLIKSKYDIPIVADEIQCGLFRTGTFSSLSSAQIVADIYCFGKQLGAGIAKISCLCCQGNIYPTNFFKYNTSSYTADNFSIQAALGFLEVFTLGDNSVEICYEQPINILNRLKIAYPKFVNDTRGIGLMCAIEIKNASINNSFITKFFKDLDLLGYWVSSVLLERENIRVIPTLSNQYTFRIQPSIHFSSHEADKVYTAFSHFFEAIENQDINYLFGHLFTLSNHPVLKALPTSVKYEHFPQNAAVFICHPIDIPHLRQTIDLLECESDHDIQKMLEEFAIHQKFTIYHTDKLISYNNQTLPLVYLGIPLTSQSFYHLMRQGRSQMLIKLVQNAVDLANKNHAVSIGLGQYTSIITRNGMMLHSPAAPITTGNTYTAILSAKAGLSCYKELNDPEKKPVICLIGAKGNIISSLITEVFHDCEKLILIYRNPIERGNDTWNHFKSLINNISNTDKSSKHQTTIQNTLKNYPDSSQFEQFIREISHLIQIEYSIQNSCVQEADIIFTGTNETTAFLEPAHVKSGAIIVDIAVPSNVSKALMLDPDVTYIKGGIAALPKYNGQQQYINSSILPLDIGECFACMAETFGLGMVHTNKTSLIGEITTEKMHKVSKMMEAQGFSLKRSKIESSF